jgi:4-hydroxybenzoate polyprenyltransferase
MNAHRQHVYQRLVNEAGMSHSAVAAFTVLLALSITVAWVPGPQLLGVPITLLLLAIYLESPHALTHTAESRNQRK